MKSGSRGERREEEEEKKIGRERETDESQKKREEGNRFVRSLLKWTLDKSEAAS